MITYAIEDAPRVEHVREWRALPEGSVIVTSIGSTYLKKSNGEWCSSVARGVSSKVLMEPGFADQPLRVVFVSDVPPRCPHGLFESTIGRVGHTQCAGVKRDDHVERLTDQPNGRSER